jgi:TolB-like protein
LGEIKELEPGSIADGPDATLGEEDFDLEEAKVPARATKSAQTTGSGQATAPDKSAQPAKPRVAVLPFNVRGNLGIPDAGASIAEMLNGALAATGRYTLVERVLLQQLLEEQELQSSHLADEATLAEAGRLHGVEAIVSGTVIQWGETITLVARMIDTNTGVIRTSAEIKTKHRDSIPEQIDLLARKLVGPVSVPSQAKTRTDGGAAARTAPDLALPNPARLAISLLPGPNYRLGQEMRFRVSSQEEGHLLVLDINADGELSQVYPMDSGEIGALDNRVRPGRGITIPSPSSGLRFTASEPTGRGRLLAILSPEPLALEDLLDQDFQVKSTPETGAGSVSGAIAARLGQMSGEGQGTGPWSITEVGYVIQP